MKPDSSDTEALRALLEKLAVGGAEGELLRDALLVAATFDGGADQADLRRAGDATALTDLRAATREGPSPNTEQVMSRAGLPGSSPGIAPLDNFPDPPGAAASRAHEILASTGLPDPSAAAPLNLLTAAGRIPGANDNPSAVSPRRARALLDPAREEWQPSPPTARDDFARLEQRLEDLETAEYLRARFPPGE